MGASWGGAWGSNLIPTASSALARSGLSRPALIAERCAVTHLPMLKPSAETELCMSKSRIR